MGMVRREKGDLTGALADFDAAIGYDAGFAAAMGKPIITLHPPEHDHALKEVDAAALAMAREPEQVVQALAYVIRGEMPDAKAEAAE
jgi:ADP-heptose:LPS heptosyltransferase